MRMNENTTLTGHKVILVPYDAKHVEKYHGWMESPELQQLTASEPLSLEEEYSMQISWRNDTDKLTFIILGRGIFDLSNSDNIESMVGDVNLFLNEEHGAEIEIMIAEPSARGNGLGKEALQIMLHYAAQHLNLQKVTSKIGFSNHKSIGLFSKLGFTEVSKSEVFEEVTLELLLSEDIRQKLNEQNKHVISSN